MINDFDEFYQAHVELEEAKTLNDINEWVNKYYNDDIFLHNIKENLTIWLEEEHENVSNRVADSLEESTVRTMPDGLSDMDREVEALDNEAYRYWIIKKGWK